MSSGYIDIPGGGGSGGVVSGSVSTAGLHIKGVITFVTINDTTWTALPPTPLVGRNALMIQNRSGVNILLAYDTSPTAWIILPANGERSYDITENIPIYAQSTSGTVQVTIEELS